MFPVYHKILLYPFNAKPEKQENNNLLPFLVFVAVTFCLLVF